MFTDQCSRLMRRCLPAWVPILFAVSLGACDQSVESGEDRLLSVTIDNRHRTFILYIPARYDGNVGAPLLVAFHGTPGSGPGMRLSTGLDEIADSRGWLIAYPNGVGGSWSAGCLCSDADIAGFHDVQFVERIIGRVQTEYPIDTDRIYSVGFSAGGIMNYRVACDLNEKFAATASVGSSMTWAQAETCEPSGPVPVLTIAGTDDPSFPWKGSGTVAGQTMPIDSTFAFWGRINGCDLQPTVDYSTPKDNGLNVRRERYLGCSAPSEVTLLAIEDGTHTWPATANAALFAFFERHALSR